ncbi:F-box-like domain superfamily [Sesbania bispinosa]|nr:F-box-like domain superfamily [Sesbania bispinosa]
MADRISTLPDEVLCHILSFLPTQHAIATSLISKRWKNLWRSVPALHFSDSDRIGTPSLSYWKRRATMQNLDPYLRFMEFVDSVLLSRDASQPIKIFSVMISSPHFDSDDVNSCSTLVVLKLHGLCLDGFSSVELPSLKTLHLTNMLFPKVRYFMLLLAGRPILEDFKTNGLRYDSRYARFDHREFENLSLTKLTRADMMDSYSHLPLKALDNAAFLRIEIDKEYCGFDNFPVFHNLTRLELISVKFNWDWIIELLKHCPKLQILVLDQYEMYQVGDCSKGDDENWADPGFVPECLSLHLRTCTLGVGNSGGLQGTCAS